MKSILKKSMTVPLFLGILAVSVAAVFSQPWTRYSVAKTSYTASADTAKNISGPKMGDMLWSITISSAGSTGSRIEVFDSLSSTQTASTRLADLGGDLTGTFWYQVGLSSGIVYNTSGTVLPKVNINYLQGGRSYP